MKENKEDAWRLSIEGQSLICPVCKMDVSDRNPLISKFEGKTYYLCSSICKMAFEKEPHRYVSRTGKKEE